MTKLSVQVEAVENQNAELRELAWVILESIRTARTTRAITCTDEPAFDQLMQSWREQLDAIVKP